VVGRQEGILHARTKLVIDRWMKHFRYTAQPRIRTRQDERIITGAGGESESTCPWPQDKFADTTKVPGTKYEAPACPLPISDPLGLLSLRTGGALVTTSSFFSFFFFCFPFLGPLVWSPNKFELASIIYFRPFSHTHTHSLSLC
jgi:hypothetical protein